MPYLNKEEFTDKVYGCWIGKSIGGTLGAPFEGKPEMPDVHDFTTPSGKPFPNDDLDLQLIWLKALEDRGPLGVNEQVIGEYWLNYIPPHWNEYGLGKSNMKTGLLPPLSGDHENIWRNSNGAWIRSEIWACCAPGCPEIATKYAWFDACVDHGTGEGTYAELFTSSVESAAFVEPNRDKLIEIGLSYIPKDCRVARSIGIVMDGYARGLDWKETRRLVVEDSEDLGWFQAPANVAFVIIGWLYGEGDYKKSLLIAVGCGDDTDCTGATLGSILGIIGGAAKLPSDWRGHVGDDIITLAIERGSWDGIPQTCLALTDRTVHMASQVLTAHCAPMIIGDGQTALGSADSLKASAQYLQRLAGMNNGLVFDFIHTRAVIRYVSGAAVAPGQEASVEVTLYNPMPDPRHVDVTYYLPEGFELVEGKRHVNMLHSTRIYGEECKFTIRLRAGLAVQPKNRGVLQMVAEGRPTVMLVPLLFLGQ
jgi:ADP-ribosylglycohydrolase